MMMLYALCFVAGLVLGYLIGLAVFLLRPPAYEDILAENLAKDLRRMERNETDHLQRIRRGLKAVLHLK
jgi:hypothetical protein